MFEPMRRWRPLLLALPLLVLGPGCDEDNDEVVVVTPPLEIRSTFPGDGVIGFDGLQNLSVDFDRPPGEGNVLFMLFPMPAQAGEFGPTGSGRNWTWSDVVLEPEDGAYAWLIDGDPLPLPVVVNMASGDRLPLMGFSGFVETIDPAQVSPEGTILFALPGSTPFNPSDPATLLEALPGALSAAVALIQNPTGTGPAQHRFEFMEPDRGFVVVGVKDTNGDLVYDPTSDWWGFYPNADGTGAEFVFAYTPAAAEYEADVSFTLRPPAGLSRRR